MEARNITKDNTPIILIGDITGLAKETYRYIKPHLSKHYSNILLYNDVRLVPELFFRQPVAPRYSIEDQAKSITEAALKFDAKNFCIVGYSYGAQIAFAVAQILKKAGKQVAVCIIDAPSPIHTRNYFIQSNNQMLQDIISIINYAAAYSNLPPYTASLDGIIKLLQQGNSNINQNNNNTLLDNFINWNTVNNNLNLTYSATTSNTNYISLFPNQTSPNLRAFIKILANLILNLASTNNVTDNDISFAKFKFERICFVIKANLESLLQPYFDKDTDIDSMLTIFTEETRNKYNTSTTGGWENYIKSDNLQYQTLSSSFVHTNILSETHSSYTASLLLHYFEEFLNKQVHTNQQQNLILNDNNLSHVDEAKFDSNSQRTDISDLNQNVNSSQNSERLEAADTTDSSTQSSNDSTEATVNNAYKKRKINASNRLFHPLTRGFTKECKEVFHVEDESNDNMEKSNSFLNNG